MVRLAVPPAGMVQGQLQLLPESEEESARETTHYVEVGPPPACEWETGCLFSGPPIRTSIEGSWELEENSLLYTYFLYLPTFSGFQAHSAEPRVPAL